MENFESLNTIVREFEIKKSTIALFGISGLVENGKNYVEVTDRPVHLEDRYLPDIVTDYDNNKHTDDQFCSIFSDGLETTQITQENLFVFEKLHSEKEILSSEFDMDQGEPILTSE